MASSMFIGIMLDMLITFGLIGVVASYLSKKSKIIQKELSFIFYAGLDFLLSVVVQKAT